MSCERLEQRRLLSASADGGLIITGTAGDDVIGIRVTAGTLRVDRNGIVSKFPVASVTSISIDLGDGSDRLDIADGVIGVYCLGGAGDDTIVGGDGNDTITSGGGKDLVYGGLGDDRIDGGPTADILDGNDGADRIYGGDANDVLIGEAGVDRLFGGDGNDELSGGSSNDKLYGDAGDDTLSGNNQNDLLSGGDGNDQILGGDGNDTLSGDNGNDSIAGQSGDDIASAGTGKNTVDGGAGNDALSGGSGNDTMLGGDGADAVSGLGGDDSLDGQNGDDHLNGGDGLDSLSGGAGNDSLVGGAGDDALLGGENEDTLVGQDGNDRFYSRTGSTIADAAANDAVIGFKDTVVTPAAIGTAQTEKRWADADIWQLDAGFKFYQERTGNTKMLKLASGEPVTFERVTDLGADILADNAGDGTLHFADLAFTDTTIGPAATAVHELGHNFDTLDENPTIKTFFDISVWRKRNGKWTFAPGTTFARDYGSTNPYEDFATALEVYYNKTNPPQNWQRKWNYIDAFLNSMEITRP
jgi:Ca2+-binding RTX toxin-like protein